MGRHPDLPLHPSPWFFWLGSSISFTVKAPLMPLCLLLEVLSGVSSGKRGKWWGSLLHLCSTLPRDTLDFYFLNLLSMKECHSCSVPQVMKQCLACSHTPGVRISSGFLSWAFEWEIPRTAWVLQREGVNELVLFLLSFSAANGGYRGHGGKQPHLWKRSACHLLLGKRFRVIFFRAGKKQLLASNRVLK